MTLTIKVENLTRAIREMKTLDASVVPAVKVINKEAAEIVAVAARQGVPRKSGRLQASIRSAGTQAGGVVRAGKASVPYAGPIHFGWAKHNIQPQPFLYDALDARRVQVVEKYAVQMSALIEATIR